jgi:hypothetical protein
LSVLRYELTRTGGQIDKPPEPAADGRLAKFR